MASQKYFSPLFLLPSPSSVCASYHNYLILFFLYHHRNLRPLFSFTLSYVCFLWWARAQPLYTRGSDLHDCPPKPWGEDYRKIEKRWNLLTLANQTQTKHEVQQGDSHSILAHMQLNLTVLCIYFPFLLPFLPLLDKGMTLDLLYEPAPGPIKNYDLGQISAKTSVSFSSLESFIGLLWESHILHAKHKSSLAQAMLIKGIVWLLPVIRYWEGGTEDRVTWQT